MAALAAVLRLVGPGNGVVAGDDLYGGTSRLLAQVAPNLAIQVTNVDTTDARSASPHCMYVCVCEALSAGCMYIVPMQAPLMFGQLELLSPCWIGLD